MSEHSSVVGGSTAGRVLACPGSVELCKGIPNVAGEAASRGSALHAVMEEILEAELDTPESDPDHYVGKVYQFDGRDIEITQDMVDDKIVPAVDWFDDLDPDDFWIEQKVSFGDTAPGAFGTADVIYKKELASGAIVGGLIDWKFGDGIIVDIEESMQFPFYMAAAKLGGFFKDCSVLAGHVYQPAERTDPKNYEQTTTYTVDALKDFTSRLVMALKDAQSSNPAFHVGDHCGWCPAKRANKCPKIKDLVAIAEGTNIDTMELEDLAEWLDRADALEGWISDLRAAAHETAKEGAPPPGWKLVQGKGNRKWLDESKAENVLARAGIKKADRTVTKLIGIPAAEKLLKAEKPAGLKTLDKYIDRPDGKLKLVRDNAPGEPVVNVKSALGSLNDHLQAKKLTGK